LVDDPDIVRVFVASDGRVHRDGIARLIATEGSLEVVGAASTTEAPARLRGEARADVVLIDATRHANLLLAREIASAAQGARVVALVAPDQEDDVVAWAGAGASGLLSWNATPQQFADILMRAARGETPCSPDLAEAFLRQARDDPARALGGDGALTERESEIAELVARGLSNKAIALRLSIELATVKNHVHSVLEKLEVHSRGEAAAKLRLTDVDRRN
jgi:two-component system, NarL family, nitrate/nitrite response regulator NarL